MTANNTDEQAIKAEAERIAKGVALLAPEMYPIENLKPYEKNSKVHDRNHIERLKANIDKEGLQESLLIEPDGTIVAGHGRYEAISELGWAEVPVRVMHGYTKAQCMIHRVSSNLTVSNKYDSNKQAEELSAIQDLLDDDFDMGELASLTGYTERDIEVLSEDISDLSAIDDLDLDAPEPVAAESKKPDGESEPDAPEPPKMVKLTKLFGVDEITPEQARVVRKFVALAEIDSPETLEDFCTGYIAAMENDA